MKKIKSRIPEGGAIEDTQEMSMEQYSETMKKQLGKAYIRFAENVIKKVNPVQDSLVLEIGPVYHPAALLRDPLLKRDTWEDFKKIVLKYRELFNPQHYSVHI